MERKLQPGDLADTLEQYIWAEDMQNGKSYMARVNVGDFKKENDKVYYKSVMRIS